MVTPFRLFLTCALSLNASFALAQFSPGSSPGAAGAAPQPRETPHDVAPPALPGAGNVPAPATSQDLRKPDIGNPTTALFAAINKGDYSAAQDAISRGANLNATNALAETPLDLSVALNRTNLTFLLLASRDNNSAPVTTNPSRAPKVEKASGHPIRTERPTFKAVPSPSPVKLGSVPGTPDPSSGFLGFAPKN